MNNLLEIHSVSKKFGNFTALNNVSISIPEASIFGLLGPNGAGKSSMFNVMTMDLKRSDGEVKILDTDIDKLDVT